MFNKHFNCDLALQNSVEWLKGIITSIDSERKNCFVFLSENDLVYFDAGNRIQLKYFENSTQYVMQGRVNQKHYSVQKRGIEVKIDNVIEHPNQRDSERFVTRFAADLFHKGENYAGTVINMSLNGIYVKSPGVFQMNDIVPTTVQLYDGDVMHFTGKVIRRVESEKVSYYGFQIVEIDSENKEMLEKALKFYLRHKNHIHSEYILFNKIRKTIISLTLMSLVLLIWILIISN